jgi:hypothetical protein
VLRPAEAAVRRLIVVAAQGLRAKLPPPRPFPQGLVPAGAPGGRRSFQLFDAREQFGRRHGTSASVKTEPRIFIYGSGPLVPLFQRRPVAMAVPESTAKPKPDGMVDSLRLGIRLQAIKLALEDLPY